jgi:hypothetical protein
VRDPTALRKVSGIRGSAGSSSSSPPRSARRLRRDAPAQAAPPATTVESDAGVRAIAVRRLDRPVHVASAPDEPDRLYVVGQAGVIQVSIAASRRGAPSLDIRR